MLSDFSTVSRKLPEATQSYYPRDLPYSLLLKTIDDLIEYPLNRLPTKLSSSIRNFRTYVSNCIYGKTYPTCLSWQDKLLMTRHLTQGDIDYEDLDGNLIYGEIPIPEGSGCNIESAHEYYEKKYEQKVITVHPYHFFNLLKNKVPFKKSEKVPGEIDNFLNQLETRGIRVVVLTARGEETSSMTQHQLKTCGLEKLSNRIIYGYKGSIKRISAQEYEHKNGLKPSQRSFFDDTPKNVFSFRYPSDQNKNQYDQIPSFSYHFNFIETNDKDDRAQPFMAMIWDRFLSHSIEHNQHSDFDALEQSIKEVLDQVLKHGFPKEIPNICEEHLNTMFSIAEAQHLEKTMHQSL